VEFYVKKDHKPITKLNEIFYMLTVIDLVMVKTFDIPIYVSEADTYRCG
jgi:hypothetical protein